MCCLRVSLKRLSWCQWSVIEKYRCLFPGPGSSCRGDGGIPHSVEAGDVIVFVGQWLDEDTRFVGLSGEMSFRSYSITDAAGVLQ